MPSSALLQANLKAEWTEISLTFHHKRSVIHTKIMIITLVATRRREIATRKKLSGRFQTFSKITPTWLIGWNRSASLTFKSRTDKKSPTSTWLGPEMVSQLVVAHTRESLPWDTKSWTTSSTPSSRERLLVPTTATALPLADKASSSNSAVVSSQPLSSIILNTKDHHDMKMPKMSSTSASTNHLLRLTWLWTSWISMLASSVPRIPWAVPWDLSQPRHLRS